LVFTDIDGVWTDGSMYYDNVDSPAGELKRFHTYDSAGVKYCRLADVPVVVITGETTEIVARRCRKLGIDRLCQGIQDKLTEAVSVAAEYDVPLAECAYVGDDVPDIPLLEAVGYSAVPANAPAYVAARATTILATVGGQGAFREFVEGMLPQTHRDELLSLWLASLRATSH
jgi:3-deoxy-D-manno-octulosonate 8-phosphate phosphatase (KDO 8-P phosphatase)